MASYSLRVKAKVLTMGYKVLHGLTAPPSPLSYLTSYSSSSHSHHSNHTLTSLVDLEQIGHTPTSGPLRWLFPLELLRYLHGSLPHLLQVFVKGPLLWGLSPTSLFNPVHSPPEASHVRGYSPVQRGDGDLCPPDPSALILQGSWLSAAAASPVTQLSSFFSGTPLMEQVTVRERWFGEDVAHTSDPERENQPPLSGGNRS